MNPDLIMISAILLIIVITLRAYWIYSKPLLLIIKQLKICRKIFEHDLSSVEGRNEALIELEENRSEISNVIAEVIRDYEIGKNSISSKLSPHRLLAIPSNRKTAELIPGVLTALGILGTFIGLSIGLPALSGGKGTDITEGVQKIAVGLQTAFYTSIVGITASLLWNAIDKKYWTEANKLLFNFVYQLDEVLAFKHPLDRLSKIESYQREETEILKSLSSEFAAEIQNVLVPGIKEGISSSISPSMDRMESMIEGFANSASDNQVDGIGKLVESFIASMNEALSGQFDELGKTIQELCEWQRQTKDDLDILIDEIKKTSLNQKEMNDSTAQIVAQMNSYYNSLNEASVTIVEQHIELKTLTSELGKTSDRTHQLFERIMSRSESIDESNDKYMKLMEDNILVMEKTWNESHRVLTETRNAFDESSKTFGESLHTGLLKSFGEFDKNLTEISSQFQNNIENIKESSNSIGRMMVDSSESINQTIEQLDKVISEIPKQIKISVEKSI